MDEDRDFEHSPLSGSFSRDGETVDVEVYRYAGTQDPWQLVVIHPSSGGCTAGKETIATDQEAYEAFTAMMAADGMGSFTGVVPPVQH
ncbi:hypothetical protein [Methylobacterium sp. PvR107]|uniref:hypothetical protein n=1 Tax=Methylobacterium sp. PvR107 TaxID=2806597 RepID=UPI001AE52224|nr:hypothetical protein [Methylobacterium sp. PvR107]MBP1180955.1 hypothetical protein [Methylobacterium sp. PvR107]